jgi:hypothetical protein
MRDRHSSGIIDKSRSINPDGCFAPFPQMNNGASDTGFVTSICESYIGMIYESYIPCTYGCMIVMVLM